MKYDFDWVIDRKGTLCHKWDGNKFEFPKNPDAIPMWVADMDFASPQNVVDAIVKRANHPIYGYGDMPENAAALIKAWEKKRNNWDIEEDWVSYTNGVVPALYLAVKAFAKVGEGVILMSPVYYPFTSAITDNGRELRDCPMVFDGERWTIDFDLFEKLAAMPDTKLVLLCNPHNPLCRVFTKEELLKLAQICLANDVIIFSDEIHSDLIYKGCTHIPLASLSEEISNISLTAMSPSKTFNVAGLQLAAVICQNKQLKEQFNAAMDFFFIPPAFGAVALEAVYSDEESVSYLEQLLDYLWGNYELLDSELKKGAPKIHVLKPEATYLMWLDCRELGLSEEELYDFFVVEAGVGIEMGKVFGGYSEGYVRMNIGCTRATVQECCDRIAAAYQKRSL